MKNEMNRKDSEKLEEMQEEIQDESNEELAAEEASVKPQAAAEEEKAEEKAEEGKMEQELEELKERHQRLQADFANFRRRSSQERMEISDVVLQNVIKDLLPVLDNFGRALTAPAGDVEAFRTGVQMIYTQFGEVLKKNGLEEIKTQGEHFDPNFHQAVMRIQDEEKEDGMIEQELQKGYTVRGRVIRPAMVQVVSN